eukprot:GHRR01001600.1.p1 GENE.GHRR01001600.1~~GHRR01001600.1.p1  ORF type:complete len:112 (-),score=7.43 GHRR01001600.1:129-464(-)
MWKPSIFDQAYLASDDLCIGVRLLDGWARSLLTGQSACKPWLAMAVELHKGTASLVVSGNIPYWTSHLKLVGDVLCWCAAGQVVHHQHVSAVPLHRGAERAGCRKCLLKAV